MTVSGNVSKRVFNESTVYYSSRHSCNTAHSRSIWSMVSVWPQWWQTFGDPRDKIWDLVAFYGQLEVGWLQPLQLWSGAGISSVVLILVSRDRDFCHVQLHPTWFEPISECRSWPVITYLYGGHLPMGLYPDRGSRMLVGLLVHFFQCHSGLVSNRTEHVCPCDSVTRAGSWYDK